MMLWIVLIVTSSYTYELGPYPNAQACAVIGQAVHSGLEAPPRPVLATVMCVPKLVFGIRPAEPPQHARPNAEAES
jgi:hypothetical protein